MAFVNKYRSVQTSFWRDPWVMSLPPEAKFFYLYLFVNEYVQDCGVYEYSLHNFAHQTGLSPEKIVELLNFFIAEKKVLVTEYEICVVNFIKHNIRKKNNAKGLSKPIKDCLIASARGVKTRAFIYITVMQCDRYLQDLLLPDLFAFIKNPEDCKNEPWYDSWYGSSALFFEGDFLSVFYRNNFPNIVINKKLNNNTLSEKYTGRGTDGGTTGVLKEKKNYTINPLIQPEGKNDFLGKEEGFVSRENFSRVLPQNEFDSGAVEPMAETPVEPITPMPEAKTQELFPYGFPSAWISGEQVPADAWFTAPMTENSKTDQMTIPQPAENAPAGLNQPHQADKTTAEGQNTAEELKTPQIALNPQTDHTEPAENAPAGSNQPRQAAKTTAEGFTGTGEPETPQIAPNRQNQPSQSQVNHPSPVVDTPVTGGDHGSSPRLVSVEIMIDRKADKKIRISFYADDSYTCQQMENYLRGNHELLVMNKNLHQMDLDFVRFIFEYMVRTLLSSGKQFHENKIREYMVYLLNYKLDQMMRDFQQTKLTMEYFNAEITAHRSICPDEEMLNRYIRFYSASLASGKYYFQTLKNFSVRESLERWVKSDFRFIKKAERGKNQIIPKAGSSMDELKNEYGLSE